MVIIAISWHEIIVASFSGVSIASYAFNMPSVNVNAPSSKSNADKPAAKKLAGHVLRY